MPRDRHDWPGRRAATGLMELLLCEHPTLLSREEVIRELGFTAIEFDDSLVHLRRMGLVHELSGFLWATRAAVAADDLSE